MINLQQFVSRPQSHRVKWAEKRWEHGIQPFFLDHVPFSLRNGPTYANQLVSVYESVIRENFSQQTGPFRVVEFGAGLGYLSYHFMTRLKERYPDLYEQTTLLVSDAQAEIVEAYSTTGLFKSFGDQIQTAVLDATSVDLDFEPVFAFSTYLLDSFSAYSLAFVEQNLMEIQVESFCDDATCLIDLEGSELVSYQHSALSDVLAVSSDRWDRVLGQAIAFLEEGFRVVPFALDEAALSSTLMQFLQAYLTEFHDRNETIKFNLSGPIFSHLQSVYAQLAPGGAYVVSDFGFSETLNDVEMPLLTATYGLSCYMMVAFPFYDWVMRSMGASTWRTTRESDQTQEWVIQKSSAVVGDIAGCFEPPSVTVSEVLDQLVTLPNDETYLTAIRTQIATLPPSEQQDYFLLTTLMAQLMDDGHPKEAERYLAQFSAIYGDSSFDALRMQGFFAQNKENHAAAVDCFESALDLCPHDGMSHAACSMSQLLLGNFERAIPHLKQAFQFSSGDTRWQHLMGLLLAYKYSGQFEVVSDLQADLKALYESSPAVFPDGLYDRLTQSLQ